MSFTTGGLSLQESVKLAAVYLEHGDWDVVRDKVLAANLLQTRTLSSAKRVCRELVSRLATLDRSELDFLVAANSRDQGYLLWAAVCRCYSFIADFAVEVVREHYITMNCELRYEDFDTF